MELRNEKIVCVAFPSWEGDYLKSTVQLMSELALHNEVLYVDYAYTWKDLVKGVAGRKPQVPVQRMLRMEDRLRSLKLKNGAMVHVLTLPPVFPSNFIGNPGTYDVMNRMNAAMLGRRIRGAMGELQMDHPIVVNAFNPNMGRFLAGQLEEKLLVYYCYDEISAAEWAGKHGARCERQFIPMTDAVVCSSAALQRGKAQMHHRSFLVRNGVDFDLFSASNHTAGLEGMMRSYREQPMIGYLGSVDRRLDYDLLEHVIASSPHKLFVFVGRITFEEGRRRLENLPNVHFTGALESENLPQWLQAFDVGTIPFESNEFTAGIYPLKINEYLAAGKPVVATNFGDLSDFTAVAEICNSADGFSSALDNALRDKSDASRLARVEFAKANSWEQRASRFGDLLIELMRKKAAQAA